MGVSFCVVGVKSKKILLPTLRTSHRVLYRHVVSRSRYVTLHIYSTITFVFDKDMLHIIYFILIIFVA